MFYDDYLCSPYWLLYICPYDTEPFLFLHQINNRTKRTINVVAPKTEPITIPTLNGVYELVMLMGLVDSLKEDDKIVI